MNSDFDFCFRIASFFRIDQPESSTKKKKPIQNNRDKYRQTCKHLSNISIIKFFY